MDTKGKIKDVYSLTPMQEGMLFQSLHDKDSLAYHELSSFRVEGTIDCHSMKASLEKLIERHDILRTIFIYKNLDKPRQVVLKQRDANFTFQDIRSYSDNDAKEKFISDYKLQDKANKYVLDKDSLLRMAVIQCDDNQYEIFWSHHHIIMDGWCSGILINELFEIYYGLVKKEKIHLPEVTPYSNYIKWIEAQDKEASMLFWKDYLKNYDTPVFLPKPINQIKEHAFVQKELELKINTKDTDALTKIATNNEVTLFTCLKSLWSILLSKVNNVSDCVYGTVVSGRPAEVTGIENMVGLFINTIPFRTKFENDDAFPDFLKRTQQNASAAEHHHYISLTEIQESTVWKNKLFDHILVYENYPINPTEKISTGDFKIKSADIFEQANYDLGVVIMPGDELTIKFLYNSNVHDDDSISNLASLFDHLKAEVIKNPKIKLADLQLLSKTETDFLTKEFNTNHRPIPTDITLVTVFEDIVNEHAARAAIIDNSIRYTYHDLNERANSIANHLIASGIGVNDNVGIFMEQGINMAACILGTLKSGAAYVPIDPTFPDDRINYILKNAELKIILTTIRNLSSTDCKVICVDDIKCDAKRINRAQPDGRAYIIYTSGTTGNPKGVEVEHKNILNTLLCRKAEYNFNSNDVCLQLFSSSFDGFVTAFFTPLLSGSSLVLLDNESRRNSEIISDNLERYGITHAIVVPSLLNEIVHKATKQQFKTFRLITLAGEKASISLIESCVRLNATMEISQEYGVTEVSVMSTMFRNQQKASASYIGSPVWNSKIYILDNNKKPAPIGINGTLYIGGIGVARGYYNNEKLTSEKFIDNPFQRGERIYNTGDTGRWLPDGTIEYIGRNDAQIKIRGLRIEPGEIENILLSHVDVSQALVLKQTLDNEDILCAYYVSSKNLEQNSLREFLRQKLPVYAVPSVYYALEYMPVTSNGKIDNAKLPIPGANNIADIILPRNDDEVELRNIFASILNTKIEKIGIDSDFFQLGGHSLRAVNLFSKIHKHFNVELPLELIFKSPTIRLLTQEINNCHRSNFKTIPIADSKQYYALSAAQQRQYILHAMNSESTGYNMPAAFELLGDIDAERLAKTFNKIIARHESLRTSFHVIENRPVQIVLDHTPFTIQHYLSKDRTETHALFEDFVKPFDLSKAPLIRVALVKEGENRYVLLIDMHHIIADGTSIMVLVKEFTQFYIGEEPKELELQYKDFAEWQSRLINDIAYKQQSDYWIKVFKDEPTILDLPTDFARPAVKTFDGAQQTCIISTRHKEKILEICNENKTTPFVVLLSVIKVLLSKISGQSDIIVGTSTAGRRHADLENVIGMFINTLPIRSKFTDEFSFIQLLNEVKNASVNAFQNQDFQFEELLDKLTLARDVSRNPLFDIMFVYQNIEAGDFNIPGVTINPVCNETKISKFDITFEVFDTIDGFVVNVEYCTKLFTETTIKRLTEYFLHITDVICNSSSIKIKEITLESEEKLLSWCATLNSTEKHIDYTKTIIKLFEERASEAPEHVAICTSSEKLSYAELNEKSDILGRALTANGVNPNTIVAVFGGRSIETVIGILAVLKAGGAYLPVDVNYPAERIKYMLENANVQHMVSDRHTPMSQNLDCFIDIRDFLSYYQYEDEIINHSCSSDLAYIVYTSGTTGNPKGVKVKNLGVVNTLLCRQAEYGLNNTDVCAQLFSPSFDGFVTSLFTPLISGSSVLLINDEEVRDIQKIIKLLVTNQVSHFISVPVLFNEIVKNIGIGQLSNLKSVTLAGDRLSEDLIRLSAEKLPGTEITQEYGVTEASVMSTIFRNQQLHTKLLVGKPAWNTQILILDKHQKLQPVGVPGEIHIGGIGVADGYVNNEELTREKFFANPFNPSENLYATGDLARWTEEGNIEFLGRNDQQVKIRGFRIELGEIESKIRSLAEVDDVVVIDKSDLKGNKHLCAFFTKATEIDPDKIRGYLITCLPGFMIPHQIVEIDNLPTTSNGKIDSKALRKRVDNNYESNIYVAAKTDLENHLVNIWKEVLSIEKIGIKDNYFSLGGDSIKAIQIATKLKDSGYEIDITKIFQQPTIEEMAAYIERSEIEIVDENFEGYIPATPGQIDFMERNENWQKQFQSKTIHLTDSISQEQLEAILNFIYKTREGLRLVYKKDKVFLNKYTASSFVTSMNVDITTIDECIMAIANTIRVDEGPLLKAIVLNHNGNTSVSFILHELLTDEWTWKIILEDFNILLHQNKHNVPFKLTPNTGSIKEYATLTEKYRNSPEFNTDIEYWKNDAVYNMPIFNPEKCINDKAATTRIVFGKTFSSQFLSKANEAFQTTPFELFLSAVVIACSKIEDQKEYSFEINNENRESIFENNSYRRTIGKFKTHYPVVLPNICNDLGRQIKKSKEIIRGLSKNGLPYVMSRTKASQTPAIGIRYFDLSKYNFDDCLFTVDDFFQLEASNQLQISCYVNPDQLELVITNPNGSYNTELIGLLSNSLQMAMEEIMECCLSREFVIETPGDLTYKDISVDAFDSLESFFESDNY